MSGLGWAGVVVSVCYVGVIVWFQLDTLIGIDDLPPNEFGDFLAGVFGPIAFFWLVLGFFQQGKELRNSADALKLQADELRASVDAQNALAETTEQQLTLQKEEFRSTLERLNKASQPNFVVSYLGYDDPREFSSRDEDTEFEHKFEFSNIGGTACKVQIWLGYGNLMPEKEIVVWPQFEIQERSVCIWSSDTHGDSINLNITYLDALGENHGQDLGFCRTHRGLRPQYEIDHSKS